MSEWLQTILTLAAAVVGSSALTAGVTLYFTRPKTTAEAGKLSAEAHKADADAGKIDAESMQIYVREIREGFGKWKQAVDDWAVCVKEKAETQAENEQLKRTVEVLRIENVAKDKTITELHGRLNA